MNWLNYHHLLYFWTMVREGSISKAANRLHLSQPTISGQLRQLEKSVGTKLYDRQGRELRLTETGQLVYDYAEQIFSAGQELMERLKNSRAPGQITVTVGIPDFLPKVIAFRLIEPIFKMPQKVHLVCHEGKLSELLADLAMHRADLVLSDSAAGSQVSVRAYNHALGESGVSWVATKEIANRLRKGFPDSLKDQSLLLPTQNTVLRRSVEQWLEEQSFDANVVAEIEDSALLKILATQGLGLAPVADAVLKDVEQQYDLHPVGPLRGVQMQFFAISVERRVTHPAVRAIAEAARDRLFRQ
ncbi:MAG: transcriptional activator NhaR [Planctomycetaceae bacterium]|nr:transcriptional activator NhaR [Planctomycetaceae bacterium]